MEKNRKDLKSGFTTGAAASAGTIAALIMLIENRLISETKIKILSGGFLTIPVKNCFRIDRNKACAIVIKNAGDDPDVTNKAEIGTNVTISNTSGSYGEKEIIISGGSGVGVVTKPGLEIPVGLPAINSGPLKMILNSVLEVLNNNDLHIRVKVEVFVPDGENLAKKTLNSRLGILGGISILGTTGIVRPMSHDAYTATIKAALSVAKAEKRKVVVFTTGRRTERFSMELLSSFFDDSFIQIGDFFKYSLTCAVKIGFDTIYIAVFFAKAVKMAQGFAHTHAAKSELSLKSLSSWIKETAGDKSLADEIEQANTARHAFDIIMGKNPDIISIVGKKMVVSAKKFTGTHQHITGIIFDYNGKVVFNSDTK